MDVKVIQTPEAFELPEWRALVDSDPHKHVFALPEWNRLWWEEFGGGKDLFLLLFLDPAPVGLAGLMLDDTDEGRRVRFLGGDDLTDYLGPVSKDHEHLPAIAESLLQYMKEEIEWDYFDAKCLPVPFHFAEWLVEAADRIGLQFSIDQHEMTAVLPLPSSFDEYLSLLTGKQRHELKRKMRRFESQFPEADLATSTPQTLSEDVAAFVEMHKFSEGMKGKFMLPERASFFVKLAEEFGPKGLLSIDFLVVDDRRIASTFSFEFDRRVYLYNSAYVPEMRAVSPGLNMVARLIDRAIGDSFHVFDFLRGRERYKSDLGAEALPLHTVKIRH